jgi:Na+/proline symporter
MLGGFLTAVLWVKYFKEQTYDLYEMIPGFAVGFALTIGVSRFTKVPPGVAVDFEAAWREVKSPSQAGEAVRGGAGTGGTGEGV